MTLEELQAVKQIVQETPAEGRVWRGQPVRDAICDALDRWWEKRQSAAGATNALRGTCLCGTATACPVHSPHIR